ncbi:MAG: helix-turn-helix transcriptional regulator [Lentisphaerae bacterium]|nr:helix-turn-helix transcriptional regulator [Lentisphaerota bacterium]
MSICKKFGVKVKELRVAQKLSQEMLAQKSGLHRTYIGGIERGERNISLINIEKIAVALDISINCLMEGLNND